MGKMLISWHSSFAGTENHGFQAYVEATESEPDDITVFLCKYSDSGNGNQIRICLYKGNGTASHTQIYVL